ncbi:MAG: dihydroorotate dehydrogenase [Candidatus Thermoplasmatota archaeon]
MRINVEVSGLKLDNPTILASGIWGETASSLIRIARSGAGGVVTKSIGIDEREGYKNPTVFEVETGLINAIGLSNPGIEKYGLEMKKYLKDISKPIIGSIYGTKEQFPYLAKKFEDYGAKAIELNLSCPHVKKYGLDVCSDEEEVKQIVKETKKIVHIPIFAKLSPNIADITAVAKAVEEGGGDGIVAINTLKGMAIDIDFCMPILSNKVGGYSGKGIKPVGLRCVYEIAGSVKIPVIGVGGILCARDAIEYIMAGATAVQIGSGIYYKGIGIFKEICNELINFLKKNKYNSIEEIIGIAQRK